MTCEKCGGVIDGSWIDDRVCLCAVATDAQAGISVRLIRQYDFEADNGLGDADENDAKPTVAWALTTNDRRFLRSLRIGVE